MLSKGKEVTNSKSLMQSKAQGACPSMPFKRYFFDVTESFFECLNRLYITHFHPEQSFLSQILPDNRICQLLNEEAAVAGLDNTRERDYKF